MRWFLTLPLATALLTSSALADRTHAFEYKRRAAKLSTRDVRGHFVLALWCSKHTMPARAWKHHALVLDVEPKHRASLRAIKALRPNTKQLAREALFAPNNNIRTGAIRAIKRTKNPLKHMLPALNATSLRTRLRAIETVGLMEDEGAVASLVRRLSVSGGNWTGAHISVGGQQSYVRDFDVEVA